MAKGSNQKLRLLYLTKILMEQTDEEHGLTMPEIIDKLVWDNEYYYSNFPYLKMREV